MKIRVTFKTPGALYDALEDLPDDEAGDVARICGKWIACGEYVTIEIDTDSKEANVLEAADEYVPAESPGQGGRARAGRDAFVLRKGKLPKIENRVDSAFKKIKGAIADDKGAKRALEEAKELIPIIRR